MQFSKLKKKNKALEGRILKKAASILEMIELDG